MKIKISPRAKKQLKNLHKTEQIIAAKKIRGLGDLDIGNVEKLSGYNNIYRTRLGNYRIVFKKTTQEIYIILIGHRKEVYKELRIILS